MKVYIVIPLLALFALKNGQCQKKVSEWENNSPKWWLSRDNK